MSEPSSAGRPRAAMSRRTPASISERPAPDARGSRSRRPRGPAGAGLRHGRPAPEHGGELLLRERLGEEIVHAGREAALAVALHRVGGERDDGQPRAARLCLAPPYLAGWPSTRPSPASGNPSAPPRSSPRSPLPARAAVDGRLRSDSRDSRACRPRPRDSRHCPRPGGCAVRRAAEPDACRGVAPPDRCSRG